MKEEGDYFLSKAMKIIQRLLQRDCDAINDPAVKLNQYTVFIFRAKMYNQKLCMTYMDKATSIGQSLPKLEKELYLSKNPEINKYLKEEITLDHQVYQRPYREILEAICLMKNAVNQDYYERALGNFERLGNYIG